MLKHQFAALCACRRLAAAPAAHCTAVDTAKLAHRTQDAAAPAVFYTAEISPEAMLRAFKALERALMPPVAVKLSTGEAGNTHYLQPALIKDLVQAVDGTIVECNTAYTGARSSTARHRQVIHDHGFDAIAKVDIMDEEDTIELPIPVHDFLRFTKVGGHLERYRSMLVLSHFKGHASGGFGGALKNISIGVASPQGKARIHTAGQADDTAAHFIRWNSAQQKDFLSSMAEAASGVSRYFCEGQQMACISVLNNLSVDCDCNGSPAAPDMHDLGILASLDPVALDQASVDFIYAAPDSASLIERLESRQGPYILEHAEKIGLGLRVYRLINLDE